MKKLIIIPFCLALLFACEEVEQPEQIYINLGDQFKIQLNANWSTGYYWKWKNSHQTSVVDTTGRIYIQSDPGLGGDAGVEEWTFTGKMEGKETLIFTYQQANNNETELLERMEFLVNVASP